MKFVQLLNEIGDTAIAPQNVNVLPQTNDTYLYTFKENGMEYMVKVAPFHKTKLPKSNLRVDFWAKSESGTYDDYSTELTGKGNPLKILSHVTYIVQRFLEDDIKQMFKFIRIPSIRPRSDGKNWEDIWEKVPIMMDKITIMSKKEFDMDNRRLVMYDKFVTKAIKRMGYKLKSSKKHGNKSSVGFVYTIEPVQIATKTRKRK